MKTKSLLRHLAFTFCFSLSTLSLHSQWVSIPDTSFGKWLKANGYSSCVIGNSIAGFQMDTTRSLIVDTTFLSCNSAGIRDLTGIQYFKSLTYLSCRYNRIRVLNNLPATLRTLDAEYNDSLTIISLPPALRSLSCGWSYMSSPLPALPTTLYRLWVTGNNLTSLPSLPASLQLLYCGYNDIDSLPTLPYGLSYIDCYNNNLTALPLIPATVKTLNYNDNQVPYVPALPAGLRSLIIEGNPIDSLPAILPDTLESLYCGRTRLHSIVPALPASLKDFDCERDSLSSYPLLPPSLTTFGCSGVQLPALPILPLSIRSLDCSYTPITALPELPDYLAKLDCRGCSNLYCLPELKEIFQLYFSNTIITCLPNYGKITYSTPSLSSLPLCDLFNTNGCRVYWNISGKVYEDSSLNCLHEAGETGYRNIKLSLYQNGVLQQQATTVLGGGYSFNTDLLTYGYSVDTANIPFALVCPDTGYYTSVIAATDSFDTRDFGLHCKPGFDLAAQSIIARFRPGATRQIHITAGDFTNFFYDGHCATGTSGTVQLVMSGDVNYVSPAAGALTPTSVSGNTITWHITDFGNVNFFNDFNFIVQTDTNAALGSQVCITVSVTPTVGDNNPSNNTLTHCFTVVGSFDPNDKQVYPPADIDTSQEWLTYTVRFQNTGTAEAQHIYITDTLDNDLDVSSFQLLAYSHQPMVQLKENAVRFNFPNINLPDSNTNEPLSHGYVQYKIKLKDNLPIGTQINNTAFIYFDFNAPVVTNTTTNTIAVISGIQSAIDNPQFEMFPNPASDAVTISIDEAMIGSTATITDVTGRKMAAVNLESRSSKLEAQNFGNGVYFVVVMDKEGRSTTKKLIIQK